MGVERVGVVRGFAGAGEESSKMSSLVDFCLFKLSPGKDIVVGDWTTVKMLSNLILGVFKGAFMLKV